jgi:signal peptidase II
MRPIIYTTFLVILDQITKYLFTNKEYLIGSIGIKYVENTGAAFSIFQNQTIILSIISLIAVILIIKYYKTFKVKLPLILLLSGTLGNLIDRVILGYVRDFIAISIWPTFNIADSCITIGVIWLIYEMHKEEKTYKSKKPKNK